MEIKNFECPFCGETVTISTLEHDENAEHPKIGCPKCKTFIESCETWHYLITIRHVESQIETLIKYGMDYSKLISNVKREKNLKEISTYLYSILKMFWDSTPTKNGWTSSHFFYFTQQENLTNFCLIFSWHCYFNNYI